MKNLSNVQKSNKLKEAELSAQKKVVFLGGNLEILQRNSRYRSFSYLINQMEDDLDLSSEPLQVNLSCITLEAFAKAFKEQGDYKTSLMMFKNLEPLNFFKLLNDLSVQTYLNSSKEIANRFLTSEKILSKLNRFYNEYSDVYDYCQKYNFTSLYLFEITAMNKNETIKEHFKNLSSYLHSDEKEKRHIVSSIFNELENEIRKSAMTERSINEFYYKVVRIDKEIEKIFEQIDLSSIHSIDSLYYTLYE